MNSASGGSCRDGGFGLQQDVPQWVDKRAFLCSMPPRCWLGYAVRITALAPPGALLAGFFFVGATPKGPPFGIERDTLLNSSFERVDERPVNGSLSVFGQHERWISWRRRA
ncbi:MULTISPECIES: TPMT family class I SAM-dependent methyltransferase [Burkholderiaceae]|uniref:TPMT family class I SAM-dependent methyltransferase n=1 Tax=Burkholderiaceae TaxID=119060 RepID=UPI001EF12D9F|nr:MULTISPECIES: TPMT family class I SAM-dependent methyltransferase [Burkholderiaceae]